MDRRQLARAMIPLDREGRRALWDAHPELHIFRDIIRSYIEIAQEKAKHGTSPAQLSLPGYDGGRVCASAGLDQIEGPD